MTSGTLYIVATPIGNLKDISYRAIEILNSVDVIACEDTRVTQKLLNHYGISTKTISYHKFSEKQKSKQLADILLTGKSIALVSDAGTPLISDPGTILIEEVKKYGIKVVSVPGACALITALSSVSSSGNFVFTGFFPSKNADIDTVLNYIYENDVVFYESPNRIIDTLELIQGKVGSVNVTIARELTKIYEEVTTLPIEELLEFLKSKPVKGEIVCILHQQPKENSKSDFENEIKKLLDLKYSAKDISQILSNLYDVSKNDIYKQVLAIEKKD